MSLDCYPFHRQHSLNLPEQPMAIDVDYEHNLLISIVDNCQSIIIHDLTDGSGSLICKFCVGDEIVIDQIVYCHQGDYIACVGHKNGLLSIYTIFDWRPSDETSEPNILELSVNVESRSEDRRDKLNGIACCQRTGNLAASCGDLILIYKYIGNKSQDLSHEDLEADDNSSILSKADTIKDLEQTGKSDSWCQLASSYSMECSRLQNFKHIISINLSIWAMKISLVENYLSVMAMDHVQVLKLELLTLQIQSDGLDGSEFYANTFGDNRDNNHNNGKTNSRRNSANVQSLANDATSETASTIAGTTTATATTSSLMSDSASTTTNFSNFTSNAETTEPLNNSEMSIITMNPLNKQLLELSDANGDSNQSTDDCVTWNLNTKKLVRLPTLMHNTSTNLSSYHICHPLELLGPASESIACRVNASIYSQDYSKNQLETVVMLCKQFDFDTDPVKSTHLRAVYLSCQEELRRLSRAGQTYEGNDCAHEQATALDKDMSLLKSAEYELITAVTFYVSTLTNCFVYALHGKKVTRMQSITNPDLCLDLRPDLLNVYLLTPLGLLICSSGTCDSTFRYDWSSSSDLNLSFIAIDCKRVLTTRDFIVLVGCSADSEDKCRVEFMQKPTLGELFNRIVETVDCCQSISIRSNLLTYLHATAQLSVMLAGRSRAVESKIIEQMSSTPTISQPSEDTIDILKQVTVMLCKQLLQKKQTNMITNRRIDKSIKHLLHISMCDIGELMSQLDSLDIDETQTLQEHQAQMGAQLANETSKSFNLFLSQLDRRTKSRKSAPVVNSSLNGAFPVMIHREDDDEDARDGFTYSNNNNNNNNNPHDNKPNNQSAEDQDDDDDDHFEDKLRLVGGVPTAELADVLRDHQLVKDSSQDSSLVARAILEASVNLLESQFILTALSERFAPTATS